MSLFVDLKKPLDSGGGKYYLFSCLGLFSIVLIILSSNYFFVKILGVIFFVALNIAMISTQYTNKLIQFSSFDDGAIFRNSPAFLNSHKYFYILFMPAVFVFVLVFIIIDIFLYIEDKKNIYEMYKLGLDFYFDHNKVFSFSELFILLIFLIMVLMFPVCILFTKNYVKIVNSSYCPNKFELFNAIRMQIEYGSMLYVWAYFCFYIFNKNIENLNLILILENSKIDLTITIQFLIVSVLGCVSYFFITQMLFFLLIVSRGRREVV